MCGAVLTMLTMRASIQANRDQPLCRKIRSISCLVSESSRPHLGRRRPRDGRVRKLLDRGDLVIGADGGPLARLDVDKEDPNRFLVSPVPRYTQQMAGPPSKKDSKDHCILCLRREHQETNDQLRDAGRQGGGLSRRCCGGRGRWIFTYDAHLALIRIEDGK
jgi:hypothetical protein